MSAFLGPVHHWLYAKIQFQNEMTDALTALAAHKGWDSALQARLEADFGAAEQGPLEDIIDAGNIHGWLSQRLTQAEERWDAAARTLLAADPDRLGDMESLLFALGQQRALAPGGDAEGAYRALDALLLDGMPCDGARSLHSESGDEVVWSYQALPHPLSAPVGGIENPYAALRTALIRGVLDGSGIAVEPLGGTVYRLVKE